MPRWPYNSLNYLNKTRPLLNLNKHDQVTVQKAPKKVTKNEIIMRLSNYDFRFLMKGHELGYVTMDFHEVFRIPIPLPLDKLISVNQARSIGLHCFYNNQTAYKLV